MSKVLVIAELDGNTLNPSTAKCVACAGQLGAAAIDILILSNQCGEAAAAAASIETVTKVLTLEADHNAAPLAAVLAPQIAARLVTIVIPIIVSSTRTVVAGNDE